MFSRRANPLAGPARALPTDAQSAATAARRRRARTRRRALAAGAALLTLAAGATVAGLARPSGHTPAGPGGAGQGTSSAAVPAGSITIALDGWSEKTLGSPALVWSADGQSGTLTLHPAATADLPTLATAPGLLARAAARLATVDPSVTCEPHACRYGTGAHGGQFPASALLDPTQLPGFGPLYQQWGITHGLWVGTFAVPGGTGPVTVTTAAQAAATSDPLHGAGALLVPAGGAQPGAYLLSGAFGRVFLTEPAWLGSTAATPPMSDQATATAWERTRALASDGDDTAGFLHGLGTTVPAAADLDPSDLTLLSSPTTGCGAGVVCVPGTAQVQVTSRTLTRSLVCLSGPAPTPAGLPQGAAGAAATLEATVADTHLAVTYPHPVVQWGAWNGGSRARFAGPATASAGFYTGTPPTVNGQATLRFITAAYHTAPAAGSTRPTLLTLAGQTLQGGYDSGMDAPVDPAGLLGQLTVGGAHYTPCK